MELFISTYEAKLDDKGRVSVPASYRSIIDSKGGMIYGYISFINDCVEICTQERFAKVYERIEQMDMFSEERELYSTAILASSEKLVIDSKGRISLPQRFRDLVKDGGQAEVLFVGKGQTFELWSAERFAPYFKEARLNIRKNGLGIIGKNNNDGMNK